MTSSQLKKLIDMEKTERFVFHGSGLRLEKLEPRQAYTVIDGVNLPDGPPAVFATHLVDYALFMALINSDTCPLGTRYGCGYKEGRLRMAQPEACVGFKREHN